MQTTKALAHRLQKEFGIIPKEWTYLFPPTESTLSSLVDMSKEMDFAIFVLGPDDLIMKSPTSNPEGKGEPVEGETWTPRDNVIFEMGLLIGTLGKERCFAVIPETPRLRYSDKRLRLHLFTDYLGTNYCTYMATKEPGLDPLDAVFGACQEIGNQIEKLGPRPINAFRALFGSRTQAVVVYPHIRAGTEKIYTIEHQGGSQDEQKHYWKEEPGNEHEIAHFDDLRAVNAIVELCGRMQVNVVATTDGSEQAEIQSLDTISFSIGLLNGLTSQAFKIIASDTGRGIEIVNTRSGDVKRPETNSVIVFNGYKYPERAENYAILVRTFLRLGGMQPIPRWICGGIEASGTAAAGVYLKNNWKDILKYYEEFGKDLEKDSLAIILQFWGRKAESARPEAIRLSFFQPGYVKFYSYDLVTKGWIPEKKKPETGDPPGALSPPPNPPSQTAGLNRAAKRRANSRRPKPAGRS
jgi:Predicted nucleotide-binding protein containing TIR-like domain